MCYILHMRFCKVPECTEKHYSRDCCRKHYRELPDVAEKDLARRRTPEHIARVKVRDAERARAQGFREKHAEYMREYYKNSPEHREYVRVRNAQRREATKAELREYHRARSRGFYPGLTEQLHFLQQGKCAICYKHMTQDKTASGENADHCHATGVARGFLCMMCNAALGIYEKHQKPFGLVIPVYDDYLLHPPASRVNSARG